MMDLQVAIFLLIFLSLSCLATLGICFVEIRSCWRQYRLRIETQRHIFTFRIDNSHTDMDFRLYMAIK